MTDGLNRDVSAGYSGDLLVVGAESGVPAVVGTDLDGAGMISAVRETTRLRHFRALVRASLVLKLGLGIVIAMALITAIGPMLAPYSPISPSAAISISPDSTHWFGTDSNGYDVLSRVLVAPRVDVIIALSATVLSVVAGSVLGLLTSFFRGRLGDAVVRASDTFQAFPVFVLALIIVVAAGRSRVALVLVVGALGVPIYLRLTRAEVLSLRERTFVETARANGSTDLRIALRHVLPNALAPAFAQSSVSFGLAIVIVAGLSFVGGGILPPTPEWGQMIAEGKDALLYGQWWVSLFPGLAMALTVFGVAVVGDALHTVLVRKGGG